MASTLVMVFAALLAFASVARAEVTAAQLNVVDGEVLPTGQRITPTAAPGAEFSRLNPNLADLPNFEAGQAVELAISPDGTTLLVLTSGYNRNFGKDGLPIANQSNEYVFIFDISDGHPKQRQVLTVANSFNGIAWNPSGREFYVSGGSDDSVHIFTRRNGLFAESTELKLGHSAGIGLVVKPVAAGLAVSPSGTQLLVANYENDSVSLIDLARYAVIAELDLRPGRIDPGRRLELRRPHFRHQPARSRGRCPRRRRRHAFGCKADQDGRSAEQDDRRSREDPPLRRLRQ